MIRAEIFHNMLILVSFEFFRSEREVEAVIYTQLLPKTFPLDRAADEGHRNVLVLLQYHKCNEIWNMTLCFVFCLGD